MLRMRYMRWLTLICSISTGCQLYANPSNGKEPLYAWMLYFAGYLCAEFGWPHRAAGYQICIVLQLLSLTFSLSVMSRLSGVNLRFWERRQVCTVHLWMFRGEIWSMDEDPKPKGMTLDLHTTGFWCRSRAQQIEALAPEKAAWEGIGEEECVVSCFRLAEDGRWHAYVTSAPPGERPTRKFCGAEPVEFGRCAMEDKNTVRAKLPWKIERIEVAEGSLPRTKKDWLWPWR